jgi:hypothetical protein
LQVRNVADRYEATRSDNFVSVIVLVAFDWKLVIGFPANESLLDARVNARCKGAERNNDEEEQ